MLRPRRTHIARATIYRIRDENEASNIHLPDPISFYHNVPCNPSPLQPLPNGLSPGSTISKTIIEPAISGTLSILQAARKNPTLKRLVFTSTVGAVLDITKEPTPGPVGDSYTADDWNPVTYEEGAGSDHPPFAYRVGKKFAELEAWAGVDPTSKHLRQLEL